MKKLPAWLTIVTVFLSGCAMQQGDFPSLEKRPYEDQPVATESAEPIENITSLPVDVRNQLDAAMSRSRSADQQFQGKLPAVKRQVNGAQGAAVSSESWVSAHTELAALEMVRAVSVEALADIDALYRAQLERETAEGQSGGARIIDRQREIVTVQVERQQAEIDAMLNRLR